LTQAFDDVHRVVIGGNPTNTYDEGGYSSENELGREGWFEFGLDDQVGELGLLRRE